MKQNVRRKVLVLLLICAMIAGSGMTHRATAAIPEGFEVKNGSNYTFSGYYRVKIKVYAEVKKWVHYSTSPTSGYGRKEAESICIGETECVMSIGTSKTPYYGETHKIVLVRQVMNPKRPKSNLYGKNIRGVNRSTELAFAFVNPCNEEDYSPEAVGPTQTLTTNIDVGCEFGYSDGVHVVGTVSSGRQSGYDRHAVSITTWKYADLVRHIKYFFETSANQNAGGFVGAVNQNVGLSSYKALYSILYSRSGSPNHTETNKRISNISTYWCEEISGIEGTGGCHSGSAAFGIALY